MSRAFTKDDDDRPERPISRPVDTERPNYVTPSGLQQLHVALQEARNAGDARNVEYLEARIESAVVVDPNAHKPGEVAFGSTVIVHDEHGATVRLHIVGEDEADPVHGTISWISPYAQALLGHRKGDHVVVQRPAGPASVVIDDVE